MALADVYMRWHRKKYGDQNKPSAFIVNHHLRSESTIEADMVQRMATGLGYEATVLSVRKDSLPQEVTQEKARLGRYNALYTECMQRYLLVIVHLRAKLIFHPRREIGTILTGHTADDQHETFFLRLLRCSGMQILELKWYSKTSDRRLQQDSVVWLVFPNCPC